MQTVYKQGGHFINNTGNILINPGHYDNPNYYKLQNRKTVVQEFLSRMNTMWSTTKKDSSNNQGTKTLDDLLNLVFDFLVLPQMEPALVDAYTNADANESQLSEKQQSEQGNQNSQEQGNEPRTRAHIRQKYLRQLELTRKQKTQQALEEIKDKRKQESVQSAASRAIREFFDDPKRKRAYERKYGM
jgi:hypothetical protein